MMVVKWGNACRLPLVYFFSTSIWSLVRPLKMAELGEVGSSKNVENETGDGGQFTGRYIS